MSFIHLRCSLLESAVRFLFGACATPDQVTALGESVRVSSFVRDNGRRNWPQLAAVLVGHLN